MPLKILIAALFILLSNAPLMAQPASMDSDQIVSSCLAAARADDNGCAVIIGQWLAQLQESDLSSAEIDNQLRNLVAALAEAAARADLSLNGRLHIGTALRATGQAATDPDLQQAILQIAEAEEIGQNFSTAALPELASPN